MKNNVHIYVGIFLLLLLTASCSDEKEDCNTSDFVGIWQVEQNICSIHSSPTVEISEGETASKIVMSLDSDTISLTLVNCVATHKSSDFLVEKEVTAVLEDDKIEVEYRSQVIILPTFCTLILKRE